MNFRIIIPKKAKSYIKRRLIKITHLKNSLADHSPKLLFLVYHRVMLEVKFNPFNIAVSLSTFNKQIDKLAKKYPIISLSDAVKQCKAGFAKAKLQAVLTFDDGYRDNYEIIYPILKRKGLPAAYFIATDCIDNDRPPWDYEIAKILSSNEDIRCVNIINKVIWQNFMQSRLFFILSIIEAMKSLNAEQRQVVLEQLRGQVNTGITIDYSDDHCMIWEQIKELSDNGMEIGAHTLSHSSLARIPLEEAMQEIKKSKEIIENNIHKNCDHFAFPFGSKKDYNSDLIDYVKSVGYQSYLLNTHGYNYIKKDAFCFKRIIMEETTNINYLLG